MFSQSVPANYVPIVNDPFLYMTGFQISNDATTPNSLLDVAAGQCRDSSDSFDIILSSAVKINSANNGLNGLDTGAIAVSKVYAVIAVYDPVNANLPGCMISLSASAPTLPYGYGAFRVIGYVVTDGSKNFVAGYWTAGNTSVRSFYYDAPIATAVTTGAATSYASGVVDLSALVPGGYAQLPVVIQSNFNANAAADTLKMQGINSSGDAITIIAQVAGSTAHLESYNVVLAQLNAASSPANKPEIAYKLSTASAAVALNVAAYTVSL